MKKLKVAQIGLGHDHAMSAFNSMLKQSELFELACYSLPDVEKEKFPDRMQQAAKAGVPLVSVEEILNDPTIEGVVVETEEVNLTNYALMAAKAGKHLHMDKPGGIGVAQFEELVNEVKQRKLAFSLGYMYRCNTAIQELLEHIKNGDLGEIVSVEAHMSCWYPREKRQWLETFPGGMMFYLGCHLIDLIYQIQGEPLEVLPMNCRTGLDGVTAEDYGMAVLKYEKGVSWAKTAMVERGGFHRRQLVVTGSKGTVELRPLEMSGNYAGQYTGIRVVTSEVWVDPGFQSASRPRDRYDEMMEKYAKMARGEYENPYTYDYELGLYKLIEKCCGGF